MHVRNCRRIAGHGPRPVLSRLVSRSAQQALGQFLTRCSSLQNFVRSEEHDAFYLAAATLLPKVAMTEALSKNQSSDQIARTFGTSSELVDYRIKRLGLWQQHIRKHVRLARD